MVKKWFLYIVVFYFHTCWSQDGIPAKDTAINYKARQLFVGGLMTGGYGGSFAFLSTAWYKGYARTKFHTFNDVGEWLQMDKAGHAWTAYHASRINTNLWRWAGVADKKAVMYGAGTSLMYMLSIEYLDGRSAEWGWSWGDVGANAFGVALYAAQEFGWQQQKLLLKFSSHTNQYQTDQLEKRADDLFGHSYQSRLLKDYNAQTYWLSANVASFFPQTKWPAWLNISFGYGAEGMFGGFENIAFSKTDGSITFDRRDIKRYRQFYLAPDIDLTKIKTKSKVLQSVLSAFNVLKFPTPALEFSNGSFKLKAVAY